MTRKNLSALDLARERLEQFLPDAVKLLTDLALTAENEAVQLRAIETILDRTGVVKPTQVNVTIDDRERQLVQVEALAMLEKLQRNQEALPAPALSLEAIVIHEGEVEELPVAAPDTYAHVIEAHAQDQ